MILSKILHLAVPTQVRRQDCARPTDQHILYCTQLYDAKQCYRGGYEFKLGGWSPPILAHSLRFNAFAQGLKYISTCALESLSHHADQHKSLHCWRGGEYTTAPLCICDDPHAVYVGNFSKPQYSVWGICMYMPPAK